MRRDHRAETREDGGKKSLSEQRNLAGWSAHSDSLYMLREFSPASRPKRKQKTPSRRRECGPKRMPKKTRPKRHRKKGQKATT